MIGQDLFEFNQKSNKEFILCFLLNHSYQTYNYHNNGKLDVNLLKKLVDHQQQPSSGILLKQSVIFRCDINLQYIISNKLKSFT